MQLKPKIFLILRAARAETLVASICPIIIGSILSKLEGFFSFTVFLLTFFFTIFLHAATNLVNDYFDFINKIDNEKRIAPFSTIQTRETSLYQIKKAYLILFIFSFIIGLYFIYIGKTLVLSLLFFPFLAGYYYTAGKKPLGYLGFGDLLVFVFFGPFAVLGTYYLQTYKLSFIPIYVGIGLGFITTAVLITNNLRDINLDREGNKKTLAVIFGKRFSQIEYLFCIFIAFLVPIYFFYITNNFLYLLVSFSLIISPIKIIFNYKQESILNRALQKTVLTLVIYTILFSIALFF